MVVCLPRPADSVGPPFANRLAQLDGLRGVAVLLVVLFHFTSRYDQRFAFVDPPPLLFAWGALGVQLFFVISGFVMVMTLERSRGPTEFVISRISRLCPTYWVAMLVTATAMGLASIPGLARTPTEIAWNLTMAPGLFGQRPVDGVYWSLEIELIFYVWMLAIASLGGTRHRLAWLHAWLALSLVAAGAERIAGLRLPWLPSHLVLLDWIAWFALGIAAYAARTTPLASPPIPATLALALSAVALREGPAQAGVALGCAALVWAAGRNACRPLAIGALTWLGAISYPLYLVHQHLGMATILALQSHGVAAGAAIGAAVALSIALAWVLHRLVERPAMAAIRSRWRAGHRAPAAAGQAGAATAQPWRCGYTATACVGLMVALLPLASFVSGREREQRAAADASFEAISRRAALEEHPCPGPAEATRVLLTLGQSNAASQVAAPPGPGPISLFIDGRCGLWTDPLPDTTGTGASLWTALVARLDAADPGTRTLVVPLAIGGTRMAQWTQPGRLHQMLVARLDALRQAGLRPDAVLWQQGEADMRLGTEAADYAAGLVRLRALLDAAGIDAPMYVARSTYCRRQGSGAIGRAIERTVQAGPRAGLRPGADTDRLGVAFRSDACHFNAAGRDAAADLWLRVLLPTPGAPTVEADTSRPGTDALSPASASPARATR
jgi:peptidoglycan/LPS O-acetylase OafA/YrhL